MIYVSTSCVKDSSLESSIRTLADEGFENIELSGGTNFQEDSLETLIKLKEELKLNFICHNYFPAPKEDFVLNLASLDKEISNLSVELCKKAIDYSRALDATKYAFHAGFLLNIPLYEIGEKINRRSLYDELKSYEKFHENIELLNDYNNGNVQLYIENNVISQKNFKEFMNVDPFFFTSRNNYSKIQMAQQYLPLLDVAHLKVSCNSLLLDFDEELSYFYDKTDYIHISDNDSLSDQNMGLKANSSLHNSLKKVWKNKKTVTIEVYSGMHDVHESYNLMSDLNKLNG